MYSAMHMKINPPATDFESHFIGEGEPATRLPVGEKNDRLFKYETLFRSFEGNESGASPNGSDFDSGAGWMVLANQSLGVDGTVPCRSQELPTFSMVTF
jgi:hypothetical protein